MSTSTTRIAPSYSPHSAYRRPSAALAHSYADPTEGSSARKLAQLPDPLGVSQTSPGKTRERLRVVEGEREAITHNAWPFVLLAVLAIVVAVVLPLVLNTQMAQRSYDIRDIQIELAELRSETTALENQVLKEAAPDSLEEKARAIGLLPSEGTGVITLGTGTVEGGTPAW